MKQIYDKSMEEFDFEDELVDYGMERGLARKFCSMQRVELKTFLKHHTLALIDAEIEHVEEIDDEKCDIPECQKEHEYPYILGRREMKSNILTYLKEQREIISKS